jgi:pyruvate dehydrogenase E2 component (dihydrolipoamide acetyltransferase)
MPIIPINIPQLGEGLQEALLVEFLKKPGDSIARDEPIYVMETDKATTEVESPRAGKLVEWTIEVGSVVKIGSEIGRLEATGDIDETESNTLLIDANTPSTPKEQHTRTVPSTTKVMIPPKTRRYLQDNNLLDIAEKIPHSGSKLMPADVDAYLSRAKGHSVSSTRFSIEPLPISQIRLNYRLAQSAKAVVPVTIMTNIDWTALERARQEVKNRPAGGPTDFAMACWAIVQALKKHPKFRSAINSDGKSLKVFDHVNLGIAVALPGDELVTAVVNDADNLSAEDFYKTYDANVDSARNGNDQADEATTFSVSNIGIGKMRIGIPAIVAPAVATMTIGETFAHPVPDGDSFKFITMATATLCFDHRIVNGIGAAKIMDDIKTGIESYKN